MQEANPTETFPLVVYEAGYDRMVEQFLPLVLDLRMSVVSACTTKFNGYSYGASVMLQ